MTDDKSLTSTVGISRLAGSFWTETYGDRAQPESLFEAVAELAKQFGVQRDEALAAVARTKVHPYRRERWFNVELKASEMDSTRGALLHYGDGAIYGPQADGTRYQYGVSTSVFFIFPMPANLRRFNYLSTRINLSGRCWIPGVDVLLDTKRRVFIFRENPFADDRVTPTITDTDQFVSLWLCDAEFEANDVHAQYGFVHGFSSQQDSEIQKPGMAAVAEGIVTGTNTQDFSDLLAAGTGIACVKEDEIVQEIATDAYGQFLATNRAVYRLPANAALTYAVGDTIPAGRFVTDDVIIQQFSQPLIPDWFRALGLPVGIMAVGLRGDMMLFNDDVPLVVDRTQTPPRVSFDVGGTPEGSRAFFNEIQARFKAAGRSLLDDLESEYGINPQTINPLAFFIKHWFRGSLLVIRLAGPALHGAGLAHLPFVKRLVPPHTLVVILADLQPPKQKFTIGSDTVGRYLGAEIRHAGVTFTNPRVSIRYVATNCETT